MILLSEEKNKHQNLADFEYHKDEYESELYSNLYIVQQNAKT
jgi:hypothetical protein